MEQQSVRVAILGADTPTGETLAFLLKQNPLISGIFLQGSAKVMGIAEDLRSCDTRSTVRAYTDKGGYGEAARSADIVFLLNSAFIKCANTATKAFMRESERVVNMAQACSDFAPKSVIVCNVFPVSLTLPLVRRVYKKGSWYHPGRIIGAVGAQQVRLNSMVARHQDLDPTSINVPITGGPDLDVMVPLFSRATPASLVSYEAEVMMKQFRGLPQDCNLYKTIVPFKVEPATLAEAFSLNRMATTIGLGLCGDGQALSTVCIRTNMLPPSKHLVCTVKFGPSGVVHNYGVPALTNMEVQLLEKALLVIHQREEFAKKFLEYFDKKTEKEEGMIECEMARTEAKKTQEDGARKAAENAKVKAMKENDVKKQEEVCRVTN